MTTIDDALTFIRRNHHAVLATRRANGDVQQSPVLVVADDAGRLLISTRETAVKTRNVRRHPRASVCVLSEQYFGEFGDPLPSRTAPAPKLDEAAQAARMPARPPPSRGPRTDSSRATPTFHPSNTHRRSSP